MSVDPSRRRDLAPTRWGLALTPLLPLLAALPGGAWLLPLLAPLPLYPSFIADVRNSEWARAWRWAMLWAGLLSAGVIFLTLWRPEIAEAGILNGEPYREEMFGWIWSGEGKEVSPSLFLPEHALHLSAFVLLTWISGGYLGLTLGALLVAYMSYFVGSYAGASGHWFVGSIVAWVPWSVVRVGAFVLLGALFSQPLWLRRLWPFGRRERKLMIVALLGIVADVTIKVLLAPAYGLFLRSFAGG